LAEVRKGVQGAQPDWGLLVAKLLDGRGVALGDLALLVKLELVTAGPDLPEGSQHATGRSGQDQQGA
jgi:hypothetical protein